MGGGSKLFWVVENLYMKDAVKVSGWYPYKYKSYKDFCPNLSKILSKQRQKNPKGGLGGSKIILE